MQTHHIISDPIHDVMVFSMEEKNLIKKYIDSEVFQRLRRIKQLGCGDLVFPGAVHTRFNHSLGACYLAKQLCLHLNLLEIKNEVMIAALLHDIGHGPFSHAFEKIFADLEDFGDRYSISHDEDWTPKFISSFGEDFFNTKILSFFKNDSENKYHEYKDIISSQLDVDRLDYLLRDSHFCGVPYGNIDLKWIISCLEIIKIDNKSKLGINSKGIGAIEHYIFSRRLMTRNIYYNGKKNAAEYLVRKFILGLKEHLHDPRVKEFDLIRFMKLYFDYLKEVKSNTAVDKNEFIDQSFEFYKNITDDDIWVCMKILQNENTLAGQIAKKLLSRELPVSCSISPSRFKKAKDIIDHYISKQLSPDEQWKIHLEILNFKSYQSQK